jgi:ADP-ribosylarginine hydrolase
MSGKEANLLEKYEASMVLHGVGDAMGYKNGEWEFNYSGQDIHDQLARLGGLENLKIDQCMLNLSMK